MRRPRLLQVCNVGQICGGTAACAWTVTKALPAFDHLVVALSDMSAETRDAFRHCQTGRWSLIDTKQIARYRPDILLLHNTNRRRVPELLPWPTIVYQHSAISPAPGDVLVYCSDWLAERCGGTRTAVLWQAVPRPIGGSREPVNDQITIGRICTPSARKWPDAMLPFYRELSQQFPTARWEFVGCPETLVPRLAAACRHRTTFWPAGWRQRSLLNHWDSLLYHQPDLPESFGRVVAEAMRAGCIPVVDDSGGFHEQLSSGGGFLCGQLSDFQQAVQQILGPERRREVATTAQEIAEDRWSLAAFAQRLLCCFDRAADAARRRGVVSDD